MPKGIMLGWVAEMCLTLAGSALCAYLIGQESIKGEGIGYCAMGIILASSMTGALVACNSVKCRKLQVCMISGAVYYLSLLAVTALFFGGIFQGMGVTALLVFGCCGTMALLSVRERKRGPQRKRKIHNW
jgi:O-antigen/teichoic acid export membrane protein